jgi:CubicO group peptidase (beta-lactamase class C family)
MESVGMPRTELPSATPEAVGMTGTGVEQIAEVVRLFIDAGKIPGAVIGVSRHGKVVYLEPHGVMDEDAGTPMREDTIFRMASSTKPVLGVTAMMMIEDGLFNARDPVEIYIPEFKDIQVAVLEEPADENISPQYVLEEPPPHRLVDPHRPVNIHDLLTHSSGLATYGLGMAVAQWDWQDGETLATWIPKVAAGPLDYQPGTRWAYSPSIGLDVVARIIEVVSGEPFNELVQRRIFDPLDMKDTHWHLPENKASRQVVLQQDEGVYAGAKAGFRMPPGYFSGSFGLVSTAHDYLNFQEMLLNRGILFGKRILEESSVALMSGNRMNIPYVSKSGRDGLGFGYTVEVTLDPDEARSPRSVGAYGWGGAFGTMSWTEPHKELNVVIMVQKLTEDFHDEIAKAIHAAI